MARDDTEGQPPLPRTRHLVPSEAPERQRQRSVSQARQRSLGEESAVARSGDRTVTQPPAHVPPPDLRIRVSRHPARSGQSLKYKLIPRDPGLGSREFRSRDLKTDIESHFEPLLRELWTIDFKSRSDRDAQDRLAGIGHRLGEDLLPDGLPEFLHSVREEIGTILLICDDPWIPWELVRLPESSRRPGEFLSLAFHLARWHDESEPPFRLSIQRLGMVLPGDSLLSNARLEREEIAEHLRRAARSCSEIPPTYRGLREALRSGDYDACHFVGHGEASQADPDRWSLQLEGGDSFSPDDIPGNLAGERPFVFLNACTAARTGPSLTGVGGFAARFLTRGCSAFIGPLWEVEDEAARYFASRFYERLLQGATLTEAVAAGRRLLRDARKGDPSWAAYAVFGHPSAISWTAPFGEPAPDRDGTQDTEPISVYSALKESRDGRTGNPPRDEERQLAADWGEAPARTTLRGREAELRELRSWILEEDCRVVGVYAGGGMGKTALTRELCQRVSSEAKAVFWRSVRDPRPCVEILRECIKFLSGHQTQTLPGNLSELLSILLDKLRSRRCLLVFDNLESLLRAPPHRELFQAEFEDYETLLERLAHADHRSCVLLTSREEPRLCKALSGPTRPLRSMHLKSLEDDACRALMHAEGLTDSSDAGSRLFSLYGGNPGLLRLICRRIVDYHQGDVARFLQTGYRIQSEEEIYDWHFSRLTRIERSLLIWLVVERTWVGSRDLERNLYPPEPLHEISKALDNLSRLNLVEHRCVQTDRSERQFTVLPPLMQYLGERLVDKAAREIEEGRPDHLDHFALRKATSEDHARAAQERFLLEPVLEHLRTAIGRTADVERHLLSLLDEVRDLQPPATGYTAGNLVQALLQLGHRPRNLGGLLLRQVDFRGIELPGTDLCRSELHDCRFTRDFGTVLTAACSPVGDGFVAGGTDGCLRLWDREGRHRHTYRGHRNWVRSVAFSSDGKLLASASSDETIRLWSADTDQCLRTLRGHAQRVWSIAFSPDDRLLASGGEDRTVRLWDVASGEELRIVGEHDHKVRSVSFSPCGQRVASASHDGTVKIWRVEDGTLEGVLRPPGEHRDAVWSLAHGPDGSTLASGHRDGVARLWSTSDGQCIREIRGHDRGHPILSLAYDPPGESLATASADTTVRIWSVETGEPLQTLSQHRSRVTTVDFAPDGRLLSGSEDQTLRFWDPATGRCLHSHYGRVSHTWSVVVRPGTDQFVTGSEDHHIRIWTVRRNRPLRDLAGHSGRIWAVACSHDGRLIASGSEDHTAKLWDAERGRCLRTLHGHRSGVWSVAFSRHGRRLITGGDDGAVRIFDVDSGEPLPLFRREDFHRNRIRSVACSQQLDLAASGGEDRTVRLWDLSSGECTASTPHRRRINAVSFHPTRPLLATGSKDGTIVVQRVPAWEPEHRLHHPGEDNYVWTVAFHPEDPLLATGGEDHRVYVWDLSSETVAATLEGHRHRLKSLAFDPRGRFLVSTSEDGFIKVWSAEDWHCMETLHEPRPYEGLRVAGVRGLTEGQIEALLALGAVAEPAPKDTEGTEP